MSSYTAAIFEWDERKRKANLRKHGFDFADGYKVFAGYAKTVEDTRESYGEQRLVSLGLIDGSVVSLVHTERRGVVRIISIRKATKDETQDYFSSLSD